MAWKKGQSGNPRGRRPVVPEIRNYCKVKSVKQFAELDRRFYSADCPDWVKHKIAQLFAAYGYGHPISQAALDLLDHRQGSADGGEVTIVVGFGKAPVPLDAYARAVPEPAPPGARQIEDLRAPVVAEKREVLEARLREVNVEIERLTRVAAEGTEDIQGELKRGWTMDASSGGGDWPGRCG
jgi:hypothetical protein